MMLFKSKDLMVNVVPTHKPVGRDCPLCTGTVPTTDFSYDRPQDGLAALKKALEKARS